MKIVIIGGGIAGLSLGIQLRSRNFEVVINERNNGAAMIGHAFLMHTDGRAILKELTHINNTHLPGTPTHSFSLRRPDGNEIKHVKLDSWHCLKRVDLIHFLTQQLPANSIKGGRTFSHFLYEDNKAIAAVFTNGEVEYGDIFVGADGGNSLVREQILGKVQYSPVLVKEIVGISANTYKKIDGNLNSLIKFQNNHNGLAFGMIPASDTDHVWFMQFDPTLHNIPYSTPEELKSFCLELLKEFPPEVAEVLEGNDFNNSYVWNTRDFDLLPTFHKDNVVLIGDAAHLALPFTSAGTTNALIDAKTLSLCLSYCNNLEDAFNKYYNIRSAEVANHVQLGRELRDLFLNPLNQNDDDIRVPLIPTKEDSSIAGRNKPIQVLYFTDPICSTCWIIQPLLRKLSLEYGKYINVEYRVGGLLPSWEQYNKGIIKQPSDAAKHWEEVCMKHDMPLDGDIWMEDPLSSSYPPSIAFKAAQMQDTDKAILFLRRIKEMVFLEKKNIVKWEYLEKAAFEFGLDSARLLRDFNGKAKELFHYDLKMAEELGVTGFPTLFFKGKNNEKFIIRGFQTYEYVEDIIRKLIPDVQKESINTDPELLFTHFSTMTTKEFSFLSNLTAEEATKILSSLYGQGLLDKYESKNGVIWISNFI